MSFIYISLIKFRQILYWTHWLQAHSVPVPVISVGNLTCGGTGKTPFTVLLAQAFAEKQKSISIISRGYGRSIKKEIDCVSDGKGMLLPVQASGDEPRWMAEKLPTIPIYVGANRFKVAQTVLERHAVDLLLLDDGYQHIRLNRDFDFLLIYVTHFWDDIWVAPLGRGREPITHIRRSHSIVLTRTHEIPERETEKIRKYLISLHPTVHMIEVNMIPLKLKNIKTNEMHELQFLQEKKIVAISAIGNPTSFVRTLTGLRAVIVDSKIFRDHHFYTKKDLKKINYLVKQSKAECIVMTEKDAVKFLDKTNLSNEFSYYALMVEMKVTKGEEVFSKLLQAYAENH